MQLKIRRSQRTGGIVSKNALFCLDARVQFTGEEQQNITRYKLGNVNVYSSEASKRLQEKSEAQQDGSTRGAFKSLGTILLAAMRLNITINSLAQGQHIECKSLDELLAAEGALMQACENLKSYLDAAATFDGREVLFDFSTGSPEMVAHAVTPQPMLVIEPKQLPAPSARVVAADELEDAGDVAYDYEPQAYPSNYADQPDFREMVDQIKIKFLAMPVPMRIGGGLVLLFILLRIW